ncbi:hybrid sensor histidine kinase/response regulator transcription factor [Flammeovirga kamogawensis]|uniref:histidine kinase n=1 Tax=Flammeovirga kamogawensis TaxID=373891 RepID=A0ABX8H3H7_9BACT|nr:hybrid sensor histidine kinase/response regulator transcription factor [Flammeovirga kamogawensis]MBB6463146.1 signal transduction histidine kinase/DNA-binding response OmpR family regulator/ligand-binding sensor domain-containing protein [Flammeovirga kamogawensis]QWG10380.1 response regulator [Flammeovirga kamogawensis]TRX63890.1 response regulator [Flammeovirga kamogawensis]
MIRFYIIFLIQFLVLSITTGVLAQNNTSQFTPLTKYGMNEGISHYGVTTLLEDHNGFIWLGTYNGLDKFNGYDFTSFRNNDYERILTSNKIRALYQDDQKNIWIGTENGLNIYLYDQQKFKVIEANTLGIKNDKPFIIAKILSIQDYIVCITEYEGILLFNKKTYQLERSHYVEAIEKSFQFVSDAITLDNEILLVSTTKGLLAYNIKEDRHRFVLTESIGASRGLAIDCDNNIYIVDYNGINHVTTQKNGEHYSFNFQKTIFPTTRFLNIEASSDGSLWCGMLSRGCALIRDPAKLPNNIKFSEITPEHYLDIGRVSDFLPNDDKFNKVWISSFSDGLLVFDKNASAFKYSDLNTAELRGQNFTNKILEGCVWDKDHVLLCSYLRGLVYFNTTTGEIDPLPKEFNSSPVNLNNAAVVKDNKGGKWLRFTKGKGKWYYQPANETKKWIQVSKNGRPNKHFSKLNKVVVDKYGYYWLAAKIGLFRILMSEQGVVEYIEKLDSNPNVNLSDANNIKTLHIDSASNNVWVGTNLNGLLLIENDPSLSMNTMNIQQYNYDAEKDENSEIPSNHVSNIIALPNNKLCIGLEGKGICIIDKVSNGKLEYRNYSEKDGLDNNVVKKIVFDGNNNLWITTDKGLNQFDITTNTFKTFASEDGVKAYAFENVGFKQSDNRIVFAAGNGICYFNPTKIKIEKPLPKFTFGEMVLFNQKVSVNDTINDRVLLDKPLNEQKGITLKYDENVFSIELLLLHYSNPSIFKVKYRLLPQDKEWIETTSETKNASFNGLPPGKYTLEAMASNSKDKWTAPIRLDIRIDPPLWKTPLAYILYILSIIGIVYIIIRFMLNHTHLKHELEIEHIERLRIDELNKTKERIFMNISHEFRTPITLIRGPIQMLLNMFKSNQDAFVHLDLIQRQSNKMLQLVNQVQDFQKAEQSVLKLKTANFDFTDLIMDIKKDFDHLAELQSKKLIIEGDANQLFITADRYKLEIVLNNLLNNAFKFTKEGDTIKIVYGHDENALFFKVEDTGIGVKAEELPYVFDRYYQTENSNTYSIGSGIGLAFSKRLVEMHFGKIGIDSTLNKGTTFTVTLPVKVNCTEQLNEVRIKDILEKESDEEKQKIMPNSLELPSYLMDESLKELNVFYVEDNEELRTFVYSVFKDYFNVTCFVNGQECLDKLEDEWPDLIISDILMPELNGLELCQKIKSDIRTSHIPVILLTSRSSVDDQVKGLEVGADFYISKPFDMKHLIATSQMLLKNRKQLRERFQIDFPIEVEKKSTSKDDAIFIEKFYELIEENLENEDIDMNVFAKGLYLNRTTFFQKVKAITNYTPYELLKIYRLKKAAELLVQENLPVADVCVRTGFKNRTHFSRMFKEYYGVSPSKYGKKVAEKA